MPFLAVVIACGGHLIGGDCDLDSLCYGYVHFAFAKTTCRGTLFSFGGGSCEMDRPVILNHEIWMRVMVFVRLPDSFISL